MKNTLVTLALFLFGAIGFATGCAPAEDSMTGGVSEDVLTNDDSNASSEQGDSTGVTTSELGGCNQCSNCVFYARCRQPRLPYGLTSWADKRARINHATGHRGCVAMINTGSYYGHVAYVTGVSGTRYYIAEGNWPSGHCGTRSGTKAGLNIAGFWCP